MSTVTVPINRRQCECLKAWQAVWRNGFVPQFSTEGLIALRDALEQDSPRIAQGLTTDPPPLDSVRDWLVSRSDAVCYALWQDRDGVTVGGLDEQFARACWGADQRLGEAGACRYFLNWFDDTPRERMRQALLAELDQNLADRSNGHWSEPEPDDYEVCCLPF